jgi:rhomboid protease GluP
VEARLANLPVATISIVIINAGIFAAGIISNSQDRIISEYGFVPDQLFRSNTEHSVLNPQSSLAPGTAGALEKIFSSMFIHANIIHIAFNLIALVYLGGYAERSVGSLRYILIYFVSGVAGTLFYGALASYLTGTGGGVLIGASGAIAGVFGIAAATGNRNAYYWLIMQIVFAVIGSFSRIAPIAFTAHVGGFIAGVLLTKLMIDLERKRRASSAEDAWRNEWR